MRLQTKRVVSGLTSILILTAIAWAGQLHNASLSEAKTLGRNSSVKSDSNSVALIQLAPEDTNAPSEHISAEVTRVPLSLGFILNALSDFSNIEVEGFVPSYRDKRRRALAVNARKYKNKYAAANGVFNGLTDVYNIILTTLTETDGESQAEDRKLGVTLDVTYMTKLMDKGREYYGSKGGLLNSIDVDLFSTGFGVAVGHRQATSSGYVNKERLDYKVHYGSCLFEGETYITDYKLSWIYHQHPDQPRNAGNTQEWHFIVVKDGEVKKKLAKAALNQTFIAEVPVLIVVCMDKEKIKLRYGERGETMYAFQDTANATMLLMLSAEALGLGTCWIGAFDEELVDRILDLPTQVRPVAIIPVGYPDESPSKPRRIPFEQLTYIDRYGKKYNIAYAVAPGDKTKEYKFTQIGNYIEDLFKKRIRAKEGETDKKITFSEFLERLKRSEK